MLLKALLLQSHCSIRSELQLVADIRVNLLYRWFLDLPLHAPLWDETTLCGRSGPRIGAFRMERRMMIQGSPP
jgi:transposase